MMDTNKLFLRSIAFLFISLPVFIANLSAQSTIPMKDDWYAKSRVYEGDWSLLQDVFDKVEKEKQLTIGIIGGSITAGAAASDFGKTSWGPLLAEWFRQRYPDAEIRFYNAGIGATNSIFGVHRVDQDLLRHKPDFVVVEYSVNDMDTQGTKMSYEGLLRKILNAPNKPAVLALGLMTHTGQNWQHIHLDVCRNYRIPYISYRDALYPEVQADNMTWRDLSPDEVHPNDRGHLIIKNLIINFLKKVAASRDSQPSPVTLNLYEKSYIYPFGTVDNLGWTLQDIGWETSKKGKPLEFTIEASRISIMYNKTPEREKAPAVYLTVDGKKKKLETFFKDGWGEYMYTDLVLDESVSGKHVLSFEYDDKAGKRFVLHKILLTP